MKNRSKIITAIALVILMLGLGFFMYRQKSAYEVDLKLTQQQQSEYEVKVAQMDERIKAVKSPDKPDIDLFIEKARHLEYLGKYGKAIDTLLVAFQYYPNTSVGWNNIAKLYEKVGDYKSAIIYYNKLISTFGLNRYYLDVAWGYYHLGEIGIAQEAYGRYAQLADGSDSKLYELLFYGAKK